MEFFSIFKKKKKGQHIQVDERKQNILQNAAAAAAFAEVGEHETARSMIDNTKGNRTILVIGREDRFSNALNDYALEMAKRLDFELLALNVTDAPLSLSAEKREAALSVFRESCTKNVSTMQERAKEIGVSLSNIIECGNQDEVVEKLHAHYPGMRYVLTEPDPEVVRGNEGQVAIPVFDLGSFQGAAA